MTGPAYRTDLSVRQALPVIVLARRSKARDRGPSAAASSFGRFIVFRRTAQRARTFD
jgi:hypothetical protein